MATFFWNWIVSLRGEMEESAVSRQKPASAIAAQRVLKPEENEQPAAQTRSGSRAAASAGATPCCAHVARDAGVTRDLSIAFDDEDVGEHGARQQERRGRRSDAEKRDPRRGQTRDPRSGPAMTERSTWRLLRMGRRGLTSARAIGLRLPIRGRATSANALASSP